ncbi:MAG: rhodanese-like domain-containing protein [Burkholderiales bacterium]
MLVLVRAVLLSMVTSVVPIFASSAVANQTPATLDGVKVVQALDVKQHLDAGVPIIDTRAAAEYAESHIKGARSVPYREKSAKSADFDAAQDSFDLTKLPADKSKPVVFYCNAGECWKSYKASKVALAAGYKQVLWFRGGIPEWKSKGMAVQ